VGDAKEPRTAEELRVAMKAMEVRTDSLTHEEIEQYMGWDRDLSLFSGQSQVKEIGKRWEAPRVSIQPQSVIKGTRDDGRYTFDQFLRGDPVAARELASFGDVPERAPGRASELGTRVIRLPMAGTSDHAEMVAQYAQSETTTGGGYLVPTVTAPDVLVKIRKAYGGISSKARHIQTNNGAPLNFPSIDDTANSAAVAAINAAPGSGGADLVFGTVSLSAFKAAATGTGQAGLKVPRELIDDANYDITGLVTEMLGVRCARKMAAWYAQGVGTTEPNGLFHYVGDVVALSGGLVQATAVAQLQTIIHALDPAYVDGDLCWIMNWATHGVLAGFVDSTNRPLLQSNAQSGLNGGIGQSLFDYPVVIDQGAPAFSTTASAKPPAVNESYLAFGDINEAFVIRDVQGIGIAVDPYTGIGSNQVLYYGYSRTDSVMRARNAVVLAGGYHA
jgi:HK97 family phage major capsid protein